MANIIVELLTLKSTSLEYTINGKVKKFKKAKKADITTLENITYQQYAILCADKDVDELTEDHLKFIGEHLYVDK